MTVPKDAISIRKQMPRPHQRVLGWVSDKTVAIEHEPVIVWTTHNDGWWAGLPGNYLDLRLLKWKVTHWRPLTALAPHEGKSDG